MESSDTFLAFLALGEGGWRNWEGVMEALARMKGGEAPGGPALGALRARALEGLGEVEAALAAWDAALAGEGPDGMLGAEAVSLPGLPRGPLELRASRSLLLGRAGRFQEALGEMGEISRTWARGGDWLALALAREAAKSGDGGATQAFLAGIADPEVVGRGWDLLPRALLASGDTAGAEAGYYRTLSELENSSRRRRAWERVGTLRLAMGDSVGARGAFHRVLEEVRGGESALAARALLALGFDSLGVARRSAEVLAGAGQDREALEAWSAYTGRVEGDLPPEVSLALARLHLRLGGPGRALEILRDLPRETAGEVGAPALALEAQALRRLGRGGEARAVQDSLVARYPSRGEAVEILFLRADALVDRGDFPAALTAFQATAELAPSQNLAGQARMRMGQIHLSRGRWEEAGRVFLEYMNDFPEGRRWDEAAFWAGRALLEAGEVPAADSILERLRTRFPLSFYSVQAGALQGLPFDPGIPAPGGPAGPLPGLEEGLALVDRLTRVGLEEGAREEVSRLSMEARGVRDDEERRERLLFLAGELNRRGLTREGINLGWEVLRGGGGWDRTLLSAIYPFPYRELVLAEAEEAGEDPFLMAGLIRQESAFWARALSRADARGLMQVLPSTGRELARARGPRAFDADLHLFLPEINLHLGMAFFSDLRRRFGEDLSILLSGYNAGPTRARRWREYPEAGDLARFVERIPFSETRGYVKNVLLNREIYRWLYGESQRGDRGMPPGAPCAAHEPSSPGDGAAGVIPGR